MKVVVEGKEKKARLEEYRCSDFVAVSLYVDEEFVPLSDTFANQYHLVEANMREREMLKGWGYRLEGF
ncbi:MAG: hypothetical protein GF344_05120 [Chitinivibrionales bacterium]|nr:hypothetical protein [Chitinivibrionales bacterium]MBD3356378.1 hypothetical protein [Chitinivibrionales bacterium]